MPSRTDKLDQTSREIRDTLASFISTSVYPDGIMTPARVVITEVPRLPKGLSLRRGEIHETRNPAPVGIELCLFRTCLLSAGKRRYIRDNGVVINSKQWLCWPWED